MGHVKNEIVDYFKGEGKKDMDNQAGPLAVFREDAALAELL